jgi:hypothetical protein
MCIYKLQRWLTSFNGCCYRVLSSKCRKFDPRFIKLFHGLVSDIALRQFHVTL